jgi:hypothetical protein
VLTWHALCTYAARKTVLVQLSTFVVQLCADYILLSLYGVTGGVRMMQLVEAVGISTKQEMRGWLLQSGCSCWHVNLHVIFTCCTCWGTLITYTYAGKHHNCYSILPQ